MASGIAVVAASRGARPSSSRGGPALVALLVLLVVVPSAAAQVPGMDAFGVDLQAGSTESIAQEGVCAAHSVTVANTGSSPLPPEHTIAITASQLPSGWSFQPAPPQELTIAAGEQEAFSFSVCPPAEADDGLATSVTLTADVMLNGESQASDTLTLSTRVTREGVFGLDVPDTYLYLAAAAAGAILLIVLLTRRRSAPSISVDCPEPDKQVKAGRGTSFPVRIRNEGRDKDVVSLTTSPVPRGWDTFLPLSDVPLEPREEQTVWLSVKSPDDADPGDQVVVQVTARSSNAGEARAVIDTRTTVLDDQAPGAQQPPTSAPAAAEPPSQASKWGRSQASVARTAAEEGALPQRSEDAEETSVLDEGGSKPVAVKRRKSSS